jgi:hypothetical protein
MPPIRLVGPSTYQPKTVVHPPPPRVEGDDDRNDGSMALVAYAVMTLPVVAVIVFVLWLVMR